jgi:hypothetical protein
MEEFLALLLAEVIVLFAQAVVRYAVQSLRPTIT